MELPTTLLRHDAPGRGVSPHHDWLVLDPQARRAPQLGLWTARVQPHWRDWLELGQIELQPLPRHRRRYLRWQGPLTDQRGWVHTAGRGKVVAHLWTPARIELTLTPAPGNHPPASPASDSSTPLCISLRRAGPNWRGVVSLADRAFSARGLGPQAS